MLGSTSNQSATKAAFALGVTADNNKSFGSAFETWQSLDVLADMRIAPEHVGKNATLYVVIRFNNKWYMKNSNGAWLLWDNQLANLISRIKSRPLQATESIVVQQKLTLLPGNFQVYVGYGIDGVIYYNAQTHQFSITTKENPSTITPAPLVDVPDLAIKSSGISSSTDNVRLRVRVNNIGDALAVDSQLNYYLRATPDANPHAELQTGDELLCSKHLDRLQPEQSSSEYCTVTAPSTEGEYYYGICVKTVIGENNLSNNCSSALKLNVVKPVVAVTPLTCVLPEVLQEGVCVTPPTTLTSTAKLNDTGITACADDSNSDLSCPVDTYPGQDAQSGRDVTDNDNSDGHAGFSFTKISDTGGSLAANATDWSCVQDNVTNLMWEVKTDDDGLHDKDWTYTWYEPSSSKNGGNVGTQNGGSCGSTSQCDTHAYVQAVNVAGWCGHNDWRMPTINELSDIASLDRGNPAIDTGYFPNTAEVGAGFWSSFADATLSNFALGVNFDYGNVTWRPRHGDVRVRLVRSGQ